MNLYQEQANEILAQAKSMVVYAESKGFESITEWQKKDLISARWKIAFRKRLNRLGKKGEPREA